MKKHLLLMLTVSMLCLTAACGNPAGNTNDITGSADMAGTDTYDRNGSVLDKGGANGTDNDSILDLLPDVTPDVTTNSEGTRDSSELLGGKTDDLMQDLHDGASEIRNDVESGLNDITNGNDLTDHSSTGINGTTNDTDNLTGGATNGTTGQTTNGTIVGGNNTPR